MMVGGNRLIWAFVMNELSVSHTRGRAKNRLTGSSTRCQPLNGQEPARRSSSGESGSSCPTTVLPLPTDNRMPMLTMSRREREDVRPRRGVPGV